VLLVVAACGHKPPPDPDVAASGAGDDPIHIVATERNPSGGGHLVVISESGDRIATLVVPAQTVARDSSPAFSPDGKWLVFVSSRGRAIDRSSLWAVRVGFDAEPFRVTEGAAIDIAPVWSPAGDAIVFASSRSGNFDVWRLPVSGDDGARLSFGKPIRITTAAGQEISPSVAADGRIAYAALTPGKDGTMSSRIEVLSADGKNVDAVTAGPGDSSPAFDARGRLAFARPTVRTGESAKEKRVFASVDTDLWILDDKGERKVVDLPFTDESGPVWSNDGRWLFATSLLRKVTGEPLLSSVIHVDLDEQPVIARMLVDRAGAVTRLAPALAPVVLDSAGLHGNPDYGDELRRTVERAIERSETEQ
jgi:Tol biopolymer transport system component